MDSSLASLPLAWERPQEERGEGSIRSDSEQPWEASINPGKPLGTGQTHPWVAVRPGEQTIVTWAENKSSEKCSREGVSPASTFPSPGGVAFFSLSFSLWHSGLNHLGSAGQGMGRGLENTAGLSRSQDIEMLRHRFKCNMKNSYKHLIFVTTLRGRLGYARFTDEDTEPQWGHTLVSG